MTEEIKQEIIKRYEYLYKNIELILSLAINKGIERKAITKSLESLKQLKRDIKKFRHLDNYNNLVQLIDLSIGDYEKSLTNPKYYLFDNVDSKLVTMFETFLFADIEMENTELFNTIEKMKNTPKLLDQAMVKINGLKERRSNNKFLSSVNPFTIWRVLDYVRNNNANNEAVLFALDVYYNLDRYILSGIDWNSGYSLLSIDEKINEEYLNSVSSNFIISGVKTMYETSFIIVDYRGNEFERENDYFAFEWLNDEEDKTTTIHFAKSQFMKQISTGEKLDIASKEKLFNILNGIRSQYLKKQRLLTSS